jgi:hypothetical protein
MPNRPIKQPYYHDRAEEVRTIAQGIFDPNERARVMQIADDYEQLARESEAKSRLL